MLRPAQKHDLARRTYPVTVYNKQSQSDCQSLCRCLPQLYKKLQKNISSELLASFGRQLTKPEDIPARLNDSALN